MKNTFKMKTTILTLFTTVLLFTSCTNNKVDKNIKMYSNVWDEIINNGKLDQFNEDNFDTNITLIMSPENIVGIEAAKDFYANYITGFSNVEFTIVDIFGQDDKLVKHWNFKGTNTGAFFGMPPTGNKVDIDGVTLVKMKDGKIAQEQDFFDNMVFLQQLGIVSSPDNMAIIQKLYDDFAKGDVPAVLGALDANVVWNEAEGNAYADGNPYIGPNSVLKGVFERVIGDHEYFSVADIQLHDMSNNQVLSTVRYKGKLKKNGVIIDAQAAHLWTLKDGKVIAFQQYVDTKQLDDALNK
jgi:steroid delta-isomerase-like uncharacterized protein